MKKRQQSVLDTLLQLLPKTKLTVKSREYVDPKAAKILFAIWRTAENKVEDKIYKRPPTVSLDEVEAMQKEGLVKSVGSNIELTDKGQKVIKIMILGDDRSSFDKEGDLMIDYNIALNNTKDIKIARLRNKRSWWSSFRIKK